MWFLKSIPYDKVEPSQIALAFFLTPWAPGLVFVAMGQFETYFMWVLFSYMVALLFGAPIYFLLNFFLRRANKAWSLWHCLFGCVLAAELFLLLISELDVKIAGLAMVFGLGLVAGLGFWTVLRLAPQKP